MFASHGLNSYFIQLFPIFNELASNTEERMKIVIGSAIGSATITYEVIAVFGYLTFGTNVCPILHTCAGHVYTDWQ